MSHYVKKYGDDCYEFVNYALMAHRAVPHSNTRYSPFYLMYGWEMRLAADDDLTAEKFVTKDGRKKCVKFRIKWKGPYEVIRHWPS